MVVFTCNHCGDSLQKPKVEKHYMFNCRRAKALTCVDCLKDFYGEDYNVHVKCVTEDERYAARGSMPNGVVKKGEQKQESWTEMIKSILDKERNLIPSNRNLLNTVANFNNVPRKKVKFMNFIRSTTAGRAHNNDIEAVWNLIEKHKMELVKQNNAKKDDLETEKEKKNKENEKKRKAEEDNAMESPKSKKTKEQNGTADSVSEKFSFKETILEIVRKKGSISTKKLQKKVINSYIKYMGETECSEKLIKKYNKKLKKITDLSIKDDLVSLTENEA